MLLNNIFNHNLVNIKFVEPKFWLEFKSDLKICNDIMTLAGVAQWVERCLLTRGWPV